MLFIDGRLAPIRSIDRDTGGDVGRRNTSGSEWGQTAKVMAVFLLAILAAIAMQLAAMYGHVKWWSR